MELSPSMQKQAKSLKTDAEMLVMADLMCIGYPETDAFSIAYNEHKTFDRTANKAMRESILRSAKFKKTLEARAEFHHSSAVIHDEDLMDKTSTAKLIQQAAMKQPENSKERIEGLMKYADIMGFKKEEVETDGTETVHFFLPLKCNQCPLLQAYNKSGGETVRPVEMERIIRKLKEEKQNTE